jgi:Protein of unknown function (DUF5656)
MLRQVVGWGAPVLALAGLFGVQLIAGPAIGATAAPLIGAILTVVVGVAVGLLAEAHGRAHPAFEGVRDRFILTLWILPGLLTVAIGLLLISLQGADPLVLRGLPLIGAALCGLALVAQDREIALSDEPGGWPKLLLSLLTYVAAFTLFTLIYQTKERSLVTATSMAALAALLSQVMLRSAPSPRKRTILYAGLIGLAAGEVTWALNYWVVLSLVGGAVLLLLFYVLVGVVEGILAGELTRRLLIEYSGVGLVGFLLILSTGPWRP